MAEPQALRAQAAWVRAREARPRPVLPVSEVLVLLPVLALALIARS
ncbi:MAG TPA: hypothetical protein VFQ61_13155 [Polyangiaceae bacterium]|nr:hypothetical protein [Polyangiaceae bacterium]